VSLVADSALALARRDRARERSEIERRRVNVARLRFIESNLTAAEIVLALQRLKPPIFASIRTVERDFAVIRDDTRRYLTAERFAGPFEIGAALMRHEMLARRATQRALESNVADSARWARIAILATQAKTQLLQDIGLVDGNLGTLLLTAKGGAQVERIPAGLELQELFANAVITKDDLTSEAERAMLYGDQELAERAKARNE
jgi:hypothetical protein